METIFRETVKISLMANWLIIAVVLLRMLLKKAPRRMVCMLWAIVALRLVLPFSIESSVSMIPQTTSAIQEAVDTTLIHPQVIPSGAVQAPVQAGLAAVQSTPAPASVLPLVWSIGVALMLCYLVFSSLNMRRLVREAVPEAGNIWICDAVTTPFILGLFRPRIYLPSGLPACLGKTLIMSLHTSKATCAGKTIGGSRWPLCFCPFTGLIHWHGLPIPWSARTLNLPVTSGLSATTTRQRRKLMPRPCWNAAPVSILCWPVQWPLGRHRWCSGCAMSCIIKSPASG